MYDADANVISEYVEELLNEFCTLGRNGVVAWRLSASGIELIITVDCGITAVKIFWAQRKLDKINSSDSPGYRENVQIHIEEHQDE